MTLKLVRKTQHAHVLICRFCGDACISQDSAGPAKSASASARLKIELENALLSSHDGSWLVRIVESGCLDVCPVGALSVRLVGADCGEDKTLTWTCDPQTDSDELISQLKQFLSRKRLV